LREQLFSAWKESGLTLEQLLAKAKLDITFVSLSRKLRGKQALRVGECEALAGALGIQATTSRRRRRGAA
jgi:hypothetical protein